MAVYLPRGASLLLLLQPGMVAISELPGALEGLGGEHLVSPEGQPMAPPAQVRGESSLDGSCQNMGVPAGVYLHA
jgi:hypothetical protein